MSNPPRQKGTAGESELVHILNPAFERRGVQFKRTPASSRWDLEKQPHLETVLDVPLNFLAIRPDRGEWLFTMDLTTFIKLLDGYKDLKEHPIHIEVKRYARSFLHSLWSTKF